MESLRGVNIINNNINYNIELNENIDINNIYDNICIAGMIHKKIRQTIQPMIQPNIKIYDIAKKINDITRIYTHNIGINGGIAFPPTISLSNVIAHFSPNKNDQTVININDNIKIDFGVHINGWCVDSAFTTYFNPEYSDIMNTTKEALYSAIKNIGIDSPISDIGDIIEEIVCSTEVLYHNEIHHLKLIKELCGHRIEQYNLHASPHILNIKNNSNVRIKEGLYAIEPFVSVLHSGYVESPPYNNYRLRSSHDKLFKIFNNLIFSDYHLEYYNIKHFNKNNAYIYPALIGAENDMICQYEHTVYFSETKKEIISQGIDY
jgi:methionyl aminopeptidase